jgi:hypothetical protein
MNMQTAELDVGGDIGPTCEINMTQKIQLTQQTSGQLNATQTADLRSLITNGVQTITAQAADATSSTGGAGAQTQDNVNINNSIQNIVNTTVSDTNYNALVSETLNKQDGKILIKGNCNGKVTIGQTIVADIIAKNVIEAVQQAMSENSAISNIYSQGSQTSTATSKGFAEIVDSLFKGIAGLLPWNTLGPIAGGICLVCCMLFLLIGAFMMFGPHQPPAPPPAPQ